jgi:hypothetical protein
MGNLFKVLTINKNNEIIQRQPEKEFTFGKRMLLWMALNERLGRLPEENEWFDFLLKQQKGNEDVNGNSQEL